MTPSPRFTLLCLLSCRMRRDPLFDDVYIRTKFPGHRCYDFSKKSSRLLMIKRLDERREEKSMNVTLNWYEELESPAPTGKD